MAGSIAQAPHSCCPECQGSFSFSLDPFSAFEVETNCHPPGPTASASVAVHGHAAVGMHAVDQRLVPVQLEDLPPGVALVRDVVPADPLTGRADRVVGG